MLLTSTVEFKITNIGLSLESLYLPSLQQSRMHGAGVVRVIFNFSDYGVNCLEVTSVSLEMGSAFGLFWDT